MDKELFKKAKRGDMKAFESIFDDNYRKELYVVAMLKLKNEYDAKDAVQETILETFYSIKNIKSADKVKPWILKVLISKCNNIFRYNSKFEVLQGKIFIDLDMDEKVLKIEDNIDLFTMLSCLDYDEKQILFMSSRGYTSDEISSIMNIKESTIRSKIRRAKQKIRIKYSRGEYDERRY